MSFWESLKKFCIFLTLKFKNRNIHYAYVSGFSFPRIITSNPIFSGYAFPCYIIAFHNKLSKRGCILHYASFDELLYELQLLENEFIDCHNLHIQVGGNSMDNSESEHEILRVEHFRETLKRYFEEKYPRSQVKINWAKNETGTALLLDQEKGSFIWKSVPLTSRLEVHPFIGFFLQTIFHNDYHLWRWVYEE